MSESQGNQVSRRKLIAVGGAALAAVAAAPILGGRVPTVQAASKSEAPSRVVDGWEYLELGTIGGKMWWDSTGAMGDLDEVPLVSGSVFSIGSRLDELGAEGWDIAAVLGERILLKRSVQFQE